MLRFLQGGHPGLTFFDGRHFLGLRFLQGGLPLEYEQGDAHLASRFHGGPQIFQSVGLRVLLPRNLSELAALKYLNEALCRNP